MSRTITDPSTLVISKEITFDQMRVFSGYPERNSVHTDRDFAVAAGLPNAVAQGLQTYAYMCEWMVTYFGEHWFRGGRLAVSFLSIVLPGDKVRVKARQVSEEATEEGTRVTLEIWCENHRSEKVAVGQASALAPGDGAG